MEECCKEEKVGMRASLYNFLSTGSRQNLSRKQRSVCLWARKDLNRRQKEGEGSGPSLIYTIGKYAFVIEQLNSQSDGQSQEILF